MTDRHAGYLVILDKDIREDDAEHLINAIKMLRGVIEVKPFLGGASQEIATARARNELGNKLWEVLYPK